MHSKAIEAYRVDGIHTTKNRNLSSGVIRLWRLLYPQFWFLYKLLQLLQVSLNAFVIVNIATGYQQLHLMNTEWSASLNTSIGHITKVIIIFKIQDYNFVPLRIIQWCLYIGFIANFLQKCVLYIIEVLLSLSEALALADRNFSNCQGLIFFLTYSGLLGSDCWQQHRDNTCLKPATTSCRWLKCLMSNLSALETSGGWLVIATCSKTRRNIRPCSSSKAISFSSLQQ